MLERHSEIHTKTVGVIRSIEQQRYLAIICMVVMGKLDDWAHRGGVHGKEAGP